LFEHDRSANNEPRRVWFWVLVYDVPIMRMNTDEGDFEVSSVEAAKGAAVAIVEALIKAGFRPADHVKAIN
jgi:hypothetical protein